MDKKFDIIVIGGGHAGIEAAHIAAKMGADVLLVTSHADLIGQMSCNPAIGGVAKGNIVREIDAMGGVMGTLADRAGIQFRMLNAGKGSAVWGPRAQMDRILYRQLARKIIENNAKITILQATVANLSGFTERNPYITLAHGEKIAAKAVILAAGTFLNGLIHIGRHTQSGGRAGEPPARGLTESLRSLGVASGRLKTCSPPRLDGRTVDCSCLAAQHGDGDPWPFSYQTRETPRNKIVCYSLKTNKLAHQIIRDNMDRSPLFNGENLSAAPRYCPSIEDKIAKFGDRDGHQLYLEPESLSNCEFYVNGMPTSLPFDAQEKVIASIAGLENARILRPGYGIEYDYFQPLQLKPSLESKIVPNLFFAGQVNGTSGYEEAACQGLMAGINAVRAVRGEASVILSRDSSYIGVLIDDLVTKGTDEPYRMFTSRAEYRLLLRQDNCDERLMPIAFELGTVPQKLYDERRRFWDRKRGLVKLLEDARVTPEQYGRIIYNSNRATGPDRSDKRITQVEIALNVLRRPEVRIDALLDELSITCEQLCGQPVENSENTATFAVDDAARFGNVRYDGISGGIVGDDVGDLGNNAADNAEIGVDNVDPNTNSYANPLFDRHLLLSVESDVKYDGFVRKQKKDIEKSRKFEDIKIPENFCYDAVPGLLNESREKLMKIKPSTLGQASRISGVTPADVSVLGLWVLRGEG